MAPKANVATKEARQALRKNLKEQSDDYLVCRDVRHNWAVMVDYHVVDSEEGARHTGIQRILACERCGTVRTDYFVLTRSSGLEKTGTYYAYPKDYQMKGLPRGVKPQAYVREEAYRRAMQKVVALKRVS